MKPDFAFLAGHDVVVYSTEWCPDCARLRRVLDAGDVKYRELSIDDDASAAERLERETGKRGVPFVLLDGSRWVRGYHKELPGRFAAATLIQELRAALGA